MSALHSSTDTGSAWVAVEVGSVVFLFETANDVDDVVEVSDSFRPGADVAKPDPAERRQGLALAVLGVVGAATLATVASNSNVGFVVPVATVLGRAAVPAIAHRAEQQFALFRAELVPGRQGGGRGRLLGEGRQRRQRQQADEEAGAQGHRDHSMASRSASPEASQT